MIKTMKPAGDGLERDFPDRGRDLLDMAYINSLPQPFIGRLLGGATWPIYDIEVETGLVRIDVCGLLDVKHIGDFTSFRDMRGIDHPAEGFYIDAIPEERAPISKATGWQS